MAKKKSVEYILPIDSVKHIKEERVNIPTEELRDFVDEDEKNPKTILYPRDISLDPQLVWKGKDEQDQQGLEVPAVPLYIQEQIQPQAIIETLRQDTKRPDTESINLFADFNGISFEDKIDFYHHPHKWTNRMILGDSLLVMNSLAEKENMKGRVQTIFIDPPYGIKFGSNWQASTRKRDVKDSKADDVTRQPEQIKAFRDTWELGIHSYLSYLRDRLTVARELLTESGSVFVQIGDENVHLVRCLMDEVFGSENFIGIIPFRKKTMPFGTTFMEQMADYLIWYAKRKYNPNGQKIAKYRKLFIEQNVEGEFHHCWFELHDGSRHRMTQRQINNHALLPDGGKVYRLKSLEPSGKMESGMFSIEFEGHEYPHPKNGYGMPTDGMERLKKAGKLQPEGNRLTSIMYASDNPVSALTSPWFDTVGADNKIYVVQTNTEVIKRCILMTTDPGDLVLDPTCGSGTTAYVAEQWGRRWIGIDTSRVALALARTRLMSAKYPYYLLSDSPEGRKKEAELNGNISLDSETEHDIRKGFVYKTVPHITLKSIANNTDIDVIYAKWQDKLETLRDELNKAVKEKWNEWEIPFGADANWSETAKKLHSEYLELHRRCQQEIDDSINKNAGFEILYDQPYEDKKCVRVTGPFTVESLSPYRILAPEEERPESEVVGQRQGDTGQFVTMILDHLRKAGVQNTFKNERMIFNSLEVYGGEWLQATGEYTDAEGKIRRVAVSIGPESGTVGAEQVKEAAKEAIQGLGFEILLICGFAFDPHVSEEAKRYGKLIVLPARINPDLLMGTELKNTGAGNLFMVFGEPDIDISTDKGGKIIATLNGIDIYDPTTGEIRSSSTNEIACWFIDTNYNGECFNVCHAYFTGGNKPYESLKKTLRADIDEGVWSTLYSNISRPFTKPVSGKIAVKVINHYGDEVLKVYKI